MRVSRFTLATWRAFPLGGAGASNAPMLSTLGRSSSALPSAFFSPNKLLWCNTRRGAMLFAAESSQLYTSPSCYLSMSARHSSTAASLSPPGKTIIPERPQILDEDPKIASASEAAANSSASSTAASSTDRYVADSKSASSSPQEQTTEKVGEDGSNYPPPPPAGKLKRLMAMFKGMTLKEIIKQYGIPIALFYWIFNEVMVAIVTYLLHFNYISQNSVVDLIEALGFGSWVDTKVLTTHSIRLPYGIEISALLITNFLVASAFLALFVPVKLPFCIWVFPKVRNAFRKVFPKKQKKVADVGSAKIGTASEKSA